jgi:hypothetical protein
MTGQQIEAVAGTYCILRLAPDAIAPQISSPFLSVTRTPDELSIVCDEGAAPQIPNTQIARGYRVLKLRGPFPLEMTGVLASVLSPLANAGVSVFAVATFDTDYLLIRCEQLGPALQALRDAGHIVTL